MPSACWRRVPRSSIASRFWRSVIGRVVYGLSEHRLKAMTGDHPDNSTMDLPCRDVFSAGQKSVEVIGRLIETEAEAVHRDAWQPTV